VIAAPSGAGKTSLVRALMEREPGLRFSISYTTRPQRPAELHGRDYFFVSPDEFERMAAAGEFLEHARVFDNRYGTARRQVDEWLAAGQDLILEIDWQGARQVRTALPECVSVFILPPSLGDKPTVIALREIAEGLVGPEVFDEPDERPQPQMLDFSTIRHLEQLDADDR
jgi:guanylate kinase